MRFAPISPPSTFGSSGENSLVGGWRSRSRRLGSVGMISLFTALVEGSSMLGSTAGITLTICFVPSGGVVGMIFTCSVVGMILVNSEGNWVVGSSSSSVTVTSVDSELDVTEESEVTSTVGSTVADILWVAEGLRMSCPSSS